MRNDFPQHEEGFMDEPVPAGGELSREAKIAALNAKVLGEQNLLLGVLAGLGAALVGALLWMAITMATGMIIGFVALAIGAGCGYAVRYAGKGVTKIFGVAGAICAFLGCVLGQVLVVIEFTATNLNVDFFTAFSEVDPSKIIGFVADTSPITYIIYVVGIYEGYKFSFRKLTPQEIQQAGLS
jgi:hypothetical protein